jgi:serine-type D-Ala-D-Ala carboxypeptidase/endopeptidase (penicillin-binding protein 4)
MFMDVCFFANISFPTYICIKIYSMHKSLFWVLWGLPLYCTAQAQGVSIFQKNNYKHATVSLCVFDVSHSKMVAQYHAQQSVAPASVVKLVTTAAALEILGPQACFETRLEYTGSMQNGVLDGSLIIRGGGDPSLGSRQSGRDPDAFLQSWVKAVHGLGIREIKGDIIADASLFDDEPVSPFWLWEDMGNYYAPGISGLAVYDNSFCLELKSGPVGSHPEIVSVKPLVKGMTIDNHLLAADNTLDSAYLYGAPYQLNRRLFGTMPANRVRFIIRGDLPDPAALLADQLRAALQKAGIVVSGNAQNMRQADGSTLVLAGMRTIICRNRSIPLSQMIRIIHEKSDNLYTEYLLRQLSLTASDKPASAQGGLKVVRDFWKKQGLDLSSLFLYDACGLSPNDRVSADFMVRLLAFMFSRSRYAALFEQTLPLAGVEGTVSGFLNGTSLEGKLRLKSGSNQVVNSYAGYYRLNDRVYAVSMLVNYASGTRSQIRKDMENFLLSL